LLIATPVLAVAFLKPPRYYASAARRILLTVFWLGLPILFLKATRPSLPPDGLVPAADPAWCRRERRFGGVVDGGWWVCLDDLQHQGCVVYSGGVRDDPSFEEAMSDEGCETHSFDPTPLPNADLVYRRFANKTRSMKLHRWGFGGEDATYAPGQVPWAWPVGGGGNKDTWELLTLSSTMARLGHAGLAVFKCDIEGAEWPLLGHLLSDSRTRSLLRSGAIRQLMFEVHFVPTCEHQAHPLGARACDHVNDEQADRYNLHAANLLAQLSKLGYRLWRHDVNPWGGNIVHIPANDLLHKRVASSPNDKRSPRLPQRTRRSTRRSNHGRSAAPPSKEDPRQNCCHELYFVHRGESWWSSVS